MKFGREIGTGKTAEVYEWDDHRVLKLFNRGYPKLAAEKEFRNALAVEGKCFEKLKAYELITIEDRVGIIYDKVDGEPLLNWVLRTGDAERCAETMADLHQKILKNRICGVPDYRDFLKSHLKNAESFDAKEQMKTLRRIDSLPGGDVLCHGDFHPGNILLSQNRAVAIDFMNVCQGVALYDIARTVYLMEYTPVPPGTKDRDAMVKFKKALTDLYLSEMRVRRESLQEYLTVIAAARKGECPEELE